MKFESIKARNKYEEGEYLSVEGDKFKCIKYFNRDKTLIQFEDKHIQEAPSVLLRKQKVINRYHKSIFDIGFVGDLVNYSRADSYKAWFKMLYACYSESSENYGKKEVCKEWLCYETFLEWYTLNFYNVGDEKMTLHNTDDYLYSPETTFIMPTKIKGLFNSKKQIDANERNLPLGVFVDKESPNRYRAGITRFVKLTDKQSKFINLGTYDTPSEAYEVYRKARIEYLQYCASYYKDKIPYKLYLKICELEKLY